VGSTLHVFVRLPNGVTIQPWHAKTGDHEAHVQGTPVSVQIPPDALRLPGAGSESPIAEAQDQVEPAYAGSAGS
jgi:hypothetical protein